MPISLLLQLPFYWGTRNHEARMKPLAQHYFTLLKRLVAVGVSTRSSRNNSELAYIAKWTAEWVQHLTGDDPPALGFTALGRRAGGKDRVQTVCASDGLLGALVASVGLEAFPPNAELVTHAAASAKVSQARGSPGWLSNTSGTKAARANGRQQLVALAGVGRGANPVVLAATPPLWTRARVVAASRGRPTGVLDASGPTLVSEQLTNPVVSALKALPSNSLAGRLVVGGGLAARSGRRPDGIPLFAWDSRSFPVWQRLGGIPVFALNATFFPAVGQPERVSHEESHRHFEQMGDAWDLSDCARAVPLPPALRGGDAGEDREANVAVEIRYGRINDRPGSVITIFSGARAAHYLIYGEARDPAVLSKIVEGLLADHGHLLMAGNQITNLETTLRQVGLYEVTGKGLQAPGLRGLGMLAANQILHPFDG